MAELTAWQKRRGAEQPKPKPKKKAEKKPAKSEG